MNELNDFQLPDNLLNDINGGESYVTFEVDEPDELKAGTCFCGTPLTLMNTTGSHGFGTFREFYYCPSCHRVFRQSDYLGTIWWEEVRA